MKIKKDGAAPKKHKYLEKFGALFTDKRGYLKRLAISAPIWLALCFTVLFFGPFELVAYSGKSLFYSYKDVWQILAVFAGAVFLVGVPILPLIRGKIFNYVMTVILSLTCSAYLQAMLFNGELGALNGDAVDWLSHKGDMLINLAIWAGILIIWLFIMYMKRSLWRKLTTVMAALVVLSQAVPLVGIFTGAFGEKTTFPEHDYYLSKEGMFDYSEEHNVLVFVLDRLDYDFIAALDPSFFSENLDGFTSYTNAITTYARTRPALSHILTSYEGCVYDFEGEDYYKEAWNANGKHLLRDLGQAGYRVDVYAEMNTMFSDGEFAFEYADNTDHAKFDIPKEVILKKMMELSAYRYSPTALKPFFFHDTNYYNSGAVEVDETYEREPYFVDESLYIEGFESLGLAGEKTDSEGSTKCFKFYHFNGPHAPYYMNEDGTRNPDGETDNVKQTKGSFSILFRIFNRMKELGIYEKSAIIITADHGRAMSDIHPLQKETRVGLFYKPSGSAGTPLAESKAPISTYNIAASIMKEAGADYSAYGRAIDEVGEDEIITRTYYKTVVGPPNYIYVYEVTGDASVFENWVEVENYEVPDDVY
ncbi:MAG: sulfatase-like hydrolase/transferase [Clostridia bacterium]|nr:sulfatase-like hydrolase/transferase [Clostridia bacterium]